MHDLLNHDHMAEPRSFPIPAQTDKHGWKPQPSNHMAGLWGMDSPHLELSY